MNTTCLLTFPISSRCSSNRYSKDGRYLVSRDYLSVKIWDINMENKPVKTIALHDYLRPMLYDLFTSDIIFDKFEICCSPDGKRFASGSYRYCTAVLVTC